MFKDNPLFDEWQEAIEVYRVQVDMSFDALRQLYLSVWPSFAAMPHDQGLSWPLFISLPESFATARLRLVVVGQETNSWYGLLGHGMGEDPVEKILDCYRSFNLGDKYRSPFWDAARKIRELLETASEPVGLVWSNLYPCDQRKRRPEEPWDKTLLRLQLLPRELKILDPHAVVFLTGPRYDGALSSLFPAAQFTNAGVPETKWVHQVEHPDLPIASYRTYHPAYLRRKRLGTVIDTVASLISEAVTVQARSDK